LFLIFLEGCVEHIQVNNNIEKQQNKTLTVPP